MNLTRNSFIKSLVATTALPQVAFGDTPNEEKPPHSLERRIFDSKAVSIFEKYRVTPMMDKLGQYEFYIGDKRYNYVFISKIYLYGISFATKERHRAIISLSDKAATLQAVRLDGKWEYPSGSLFPLDFPIYDFADAIGDFNRKLLPHQPNASRKNKDGLI